jgi:asparagine synthase (glutamine-hydrolysing)
MCGIAGIVGTEAEPGTAERMARCLVHRGPDDFGVWESDGAQLGHTRLAILDPTPAGHQPMQLGPFVLAYNGEIYNHAELRKQLRGPFASGTDSETLLHAFSEWGTGCVSHLTGMFGFAVWDQRRHRLVLARDRMGIKPLYYRRLSDGLAFSSELKGLLALGPSAIDHNALRDYFTYKFIPSPKTAYSGIAKLPPAHTLVWEDGRIEIERYWQPVSSTEISDPREAELRLDELFKVVIPEHEMSDVPTGVFLSGGIDSATVVSFLDRPRTFTLGFDVAHRDESDGARRVAEHFGTDHREERVHPAGIEEALELIPRLFDEPFGDSAAWSNWEVARLARRHVTVALSGEGGDELFLGYQRHGKMMQPAAGPFTRFGAALAPTFSQTSRSLERRSSAGLDRYAILSGPFTPAEQQLLLHPRLLEAGDPDPMWAFRAVWRVDVEPRKAMQWVDIHTTLPDGILTKVDRTSMDHALEVRPPLLDHRVVEFALSLSPQLMRSDDGRIGKLIIRRLMEPRLPAGHLDRPKSGFNLPIRRWVRSQPEVLKSALDRLADVSVIRRPQWTSFGSEQIWSLLVLDRWLQRNG